MSARIAKTGLPRPPIKGKARKMRTDRGHEDFVRGLPCLSCGREPQPRLRNEFAHVRMGTDGGMSLRPSAKYGVPLCAHCHRIAPGKEAQHRQPEAEFWAKLGIDPTDVSLRLWAISGDEDRQAKGEALIFKARQRMALNGGK